MHDRPTEGWILAGIIDGARAEPALDRSVAGMPYVLRLACDLVAAGCRTLHVVWQGNEPAPSLEAISHEPRLRGATLDVITTAPAGMSGDPILLVRADRVYHRDNAKEVIKAWVTTDAVAAVLAPDHDAHVITDRARAADLVSAGPSPGGLAAAVQALSPATGRLPYLGFTTTAPDAAALLRAERTLVWSLRKAADGIASKAINRHLSLPVSFVLMRTRVHPNYVTLLCFLLAVTGAFTISRGGYWAGAIGMLIFNLGSIFDGVDGELARLKYQQGRLGQWLDTVVDDLGNVAYITGITLNLHAAGVSWAAPVGIAGLTAFFITQTGQYALIALVYKSGDLAAIPWLFQSADFLSAENPGIWGTLPKMLKRDFALTMFVVFAFLGWLHVILAIFATSAIGFLIVFLAQLARNMHTLSSQRR